MPIYEYRCKKGHTFDVRQRMGDDPVSSCEVCGNPVARVFHPPSVHFKGSGFYNTDYGTRKRSREKESGGEGGGGKESSAGSSNSGSGSESGSGSGSGSSDGGGASSGSDSSAKKSSETAKA